MNLTLITCNIRFDNPADGPHAWEHRRDFLARTLLAHDPDLIATQEGRFHQLKNLEDLLIDYEMIDLHRSWIGERMYPTFFVRKNKFELSKSEDIWLSETPDLAGSKSFESSFPRLFTWVKIQPVDSQKMIFVINTHLDHKQSHTRAEQARVLGEEVKKIWDGVSPVVIMGDFNEDPQGKVRSKIEEHFPNIQDSWKLFNTNEESSHHGFGKELIHGSRIDWIMVDEKIKVINCLMDKTSLEGLYPTDHYPVICRLSL